MHNESARIRFGVQAVIINQEGKIFLAKRSKNVKINIDRWECPGGGLEFGETLEEAVKREIMEEHGVEIEVLDELGSVEYISPNKDSHHVGPGFLCKITSGTPKICEPDKCVEIGWFSLEEAKKLTLTEFAEKDLENYERWLTKR